MTKDKQQSYCSPVIREICIAPRTRILGVSTGDITSPNVEEDEDGNISFSGF